MSGAVISVPPGAASLLRRLHAAGFDAYVVGGCVRDSLLHKAVHDWDICTSALPDEMRRVFADRRLHDTGVRHGTLTIVSEDGRPYEVTTFRTDGTYSDNRHPDSVTFVKSLREDAARRDFTINSMAYSEEEGLIDCFGGRSDLSSRLIRCVGDADARFREDALRILRALRFASAYGFAIEAETAAAIHRSAALLNRIAPERVRDELCKLLPGPGVLPVLLEYSDVITVILPELRPCVGFEQHNRYHPYTVYEHIARAVAGDTGGDATVRLALLLHDAGKPQCYTEDENGGHFRGHSVPGSRIARDAATRLRFDNSTRDAVAELVLHHDAAIAPTPKSVRRWLNKIGEQRFRQLLDVQRADILAHAADTQCARLERCGELQAALDQVLAEKQCFTMAALAVDGNDIMQALGLPQGKAVGSVLRRLLDAVIAGELANDRDALLREAENCLADVPRPRRPRHSENAP